MRLVGTEYPSLARWDTVHTSLVRATFPKPYLAIGCRSFNSAAPLHGWAFCHCRSSPSCSLEATMGIYHAKTFTACTIGGWDAFRSWLSAGRYTERTVHPAARGWLAWYAMQVVVQNRARNALDRRQHREGMITTCLLAPILVPNCRSRSADGHRKRSGEAKRAREEEVQSGLEQGWAARRRELPATGHLEPPNTKHPPNFAKDAWHVEIEAPNHSPRAPIELSGTPNSLACLPDLFPAPATFTSHCSIIS